MQERVLESNFELSEIPQEAGTAARRIWQYLPQTAAVLLALNLLTFAAVQLPITGHTDYATVRTESSGIYIPEGEKQSPFDSSAIAAGKRQAKPYIPHLKPLLVSTAAPQALESPNFPMPARSIPAAAVMNIPARSEQSLNLKRSSEPAKATVQNLN